MIPADDAEAGFVDEGGGEDFDVVESPALIAEGGVGGGVGAVGGEVRVFVDAGTGADWDEAGDDEAGVVPGVFEEEAVGGADVLIEADVELVSRLALGGVEGEVAIGGRRGGIGEEGEEFGGGGVEAGAGDLVGGEGCAKGAGEGGGVEDLGSEGGEVAG